LRSYGMVVMLDLGISLKRVNVAGTALIRFAGGIVAYLCGYSTVGRAA
jgi:hypothetical protein